jgi:hypothetical protein
LHCTEAQVEALRVENSSLKKELQALKTIHEKEIGVISKRIDRFQSLLSEMHETTIALGSFSLEEQPPVVLRKIVRLKPHRSKSAGSARAPDPSSLSDPHLDKLISQYTKSPRTPATPAISPHQKSLTPTKKDSQRVSRRK